MTQGITPGMAPRMAEDRDWQRLDKWLWCARLMKARTECARLAAGGLVRINRQPTDKPHARLRVGDVLTVPLREQVRVLRVVSLAARRGPADEARRLYEEIAEDKVSGLEPSAERCTEPCTEPCTPGGTSSYARQTAMSGVER